MQRVETQAAGWTAWELCAAMIDPIAPIRSWCALVEAWLFRAARETGDVYWLASPSEDVVRRLMAVCAGNLTGP